MLYFEKNIPNMDELLTIEAIRERYHELMADTYDCLTRDDLYKGYVVRTRINALLDVLIPMLRSREITCMKLDLYHMRNRLQAVPYRHRSD